jgi:hypothetical protein
MSSLLALASCMSAAPTVSPGASVEIPTPPATGNPASPAPQVEADSVSKIDAAELAGTIDPDLALVSRLYAALDYGSLPAEYLSSNPAAPEATGILAELSLRLPQLSPDLRAKVAPFLLRPDDAASIWGKRLAPASQVNQVTLAAAYVAQAEADCTAGPYFACVDAVNTPIRVWYDISGEGAAEQAAALAAEIDASHMWTKEQTAMVGHTPCSDGQRGGNSRLDFYLVSTAKFAFDGRKADIELPPDPDQPEEKPVKADGVAVPESEDACGTIAYIVVDAAQAASELKITAAHELFHAFQFSFKNARKWDHGWWLEATATWAEDLVYPADNSERRRLKGYWAAVSGPEGPVDTYIYGQPPQYAAYILPFYLRQQLASANGAVIGQIWQAAETQDPLEVIAKLEAWPDKFKEFALWNWNRDDPKLSAYRDNGSGIDPAVLYQLSACMSQADVCERRADESYWSVLANGTHTFPLSIRYASVNYLAGRPDLDVEKLTFDLSGVRGNQGIGLQAIIWIGDADNPSELKIEDWSELAKREFCMNEEDVERIVLVVSNSNTAQQFDGLVNVEGRSSGCAGWRGTMTATMTWDRPEGNGTSTTTFEGLWSEFTDSEVTRCFYPLDGECEVYYHPDGTIKWTWDTHQHNFDYICNETTSGSVPTGLELHDDQQEFVIAPIADGKFKYWGMGHISTFPDFKCIANVGEGTYAPPGFFDISETASSSRPVGGGNTCGSMDFVFEAQADTISGSCYEFEYSYNSLLIEWDLHRVGPPPPGG